MAFLTSERTNDCEILSAREDKMNRILKRPCNVLFIIRDTDEMSGSKTTYFIHFRNGEKVVISRENTQVEQHET